MPSLLLTIIAAVLRYSYQQTPLNRLLLSIIVVGLVYGSLYPWRLAEFPRTALNWTPAIGRALMLDTILNVLVYVPFGLSARLVFRSTALAWAFGSLLSFLIEYAQLYFVSRDASWRDVFANSAGSLLGAALSARIAISFAWVRPGDAMAKLLLFTWFAASLFPFIPSVRIHKLEAALQALLHPSLGLLPVIDSLLCGCLLHHLWLRSGLPRRRALAAGWIAATLLYAGLVITQGFSLPVLVLTLSGYAIAACLPSRSWLTAARTLAIACTVWVLMRELYPFQFAAEAAEFHWIPFYGAFEAPRDLVTRTILGKFFLYVSTIWIWVAAGKRLAVATALTTSILVLGEFAQRYLPERVPESLDPLIALTGGLLIFGWRAASTAKPPSTTLR